MISTEPFFKVMNMYYLGIDGGGTKTTCLVCDDTLKEVYRYVGSSINFYSEGFEKARRNMSDMLENIKENTGIAHFAGVCVGSSALFGRADEETRNKFCDGVFSCDKILMDSDLFIALKACETENPLVVIAGTGSMTAALTPDGKVITKGGYGYILGDEGSGYRIAVDAIRAAVRSLDGTGEKTVLGEKLLEFSSVSSKEDLPTFFYSSDTDRKKTASFATTVLLSADNGEKTSLKILENQAYELSLTVKALIRELPEKPSVFLYGGIFEHSEIFSNYFKKNIEELCDGCTLLKCEPAFGAVIAAKEFYEKNAKA